MPGAYGSRARFQEALAAGAHGVQVGTAFAFCEESGLDPDLRQRFLTSIVEPRGRRLHGPGRLTDRLPVQGGGARGHPLGATPRTRIARACATSATSAGPTSAPTGTLDYRCPSEPVDDYVRKGGQVEDTVGRKCLCNALVTNIGMGQRRPNGYEELPMLTAGNDLASVRAHISPGNLSYHARDVVASLLAEDSYATTRLNATAPGIVTGCPSRIHSAAIRPERGRRLEPGPAGAGDRDDRRPAGMRADDRATVRPHRVDAGPDVAEAHVLQARQAVGQPLRHELDVLVRRVASRGRPDRRCRG